MVNQLIKLELLEKYTIEKFGYGNPGSKENPTIWFLGPEEGGNYNQQKSTRIEAWFAISKSKNFVDILEFHQKLDDLLPGSSLAQHFIGKKLINPTWGGIVQIIAGFEGGICLNREGKREFQAEKLGRSDSTNCILELSPFSSKALKDKSWPDKKITLENLLPKRIIALSELITKHLPKVVFMHTEIYWKHFEKVIEEVEGIDNFNREEINIAENFRHYQGKFSMYVLIYAPSYAIKGGSETLFNLGKEIKKLIDENK